MSDDPEEPTSEGVREGHATGTDAAVAPDDERSLTYLDVVRQWWPLAGGWFFMTIEQVLVTAVVARMPAPEIQLAAWGVAFAISILIQSPSTVLLPTSTALARDGATYRRLARYAARVLAALVTVHFLIAFTPAYDVVVRQWMGVPSEVADVARLTLLIMVPWSLGTGHRRFLQGVMIRYGRAKIVILGTFVRLGVAGTVLAIGAWTQVLPGAHLAAAAIILGVLSEMTYTRFRAASVIRRHLPDGPEPERPLTPRRFTAFYVPLVTLTLLTMFVQTLVTVVLARMPLAIDSLAVWPVLFGFLMILQSPGWAYTEVVISLLRRPNAVRVLRRFTWGLVAGITALVVAISATPAAGFWFERVAGLSPRLADLAVAGLWLAVAMPGLRVLHSWYQGAIMYGERTRGIFESVLAFLLVATASFAFGIVWGGVPGLYVGVIGMTLAMIAQAAWLAVRARPILAPHEGSHA
ncbi:MAG: hypothetical protein WD336_03140 [Trueperaceae bacterium]